MGTVFPASSGEKCPRDDCGSRQVERLDFANPSLDSPARTLWLCLTCQRPFKLLRGAEAQVGQVTGRKRPVVQLSKSALHATHVAGGRMP